MLATRIKAVCDVVVVNMSWRVLLVHFIALHFPFDIYTYLVD